MPQGSFLSFAIAVRFLKIRFSAMDLLKACDEKQDRSSKPQEQVGRCLGKTIQTTTRSWRRQLTALKAALEKAESSSESKNLNSQAGLVLLLIVESLAQGSGSPHRQGHRVLSEVQAAVLLLVASRFVAGRLMLAQGQTTDQKQLPQKSTDVRKELSPTPRWRTSVSSPPTTSTVPVSKSWSTPWRGGNTHTPETF